MKKVTEKELENLLLEYLSRTGWFCWKNQTVGIYNAKKKCYQMPNSPHALKGVSDIVAIKRGRVLFIEVKTLKGKQSEHQKEFERNLKTMGGNYLLIRSLKELKEQLLEK